MTNPESNRHGPLTDDIFLQTSQHLWGDQVYGETALSILEDERHYARATVWQSNSAMGEKQFFVGTYPGLEFNQQRLKVESYELRDVARAAGKFVREHVKPPFSLVMQEVDEFRKQYDPRAIFDIVPTLPVGRFLAPYLDAKGYLSHNLHGTLGKALDVLGVASGARAAESATSTITELDGQDFISYDELRRKLVTNPYSLHHYTSLPLKVNVFGEKQLKTGQPMPWGEMIFEGKVKAGMGRGFEWEKVAISSLRAMARGGYGKNGTKGPLILKDLFGD